MADGKYWSQHLLIMLIADQLGLANSDFFGQGNLEIGQGKVSEKSGNFTFYSLWEPCKTKATYQTSFGVSKLKRRLHMLLRVYTCQNATLLENTC